MTFYTINFDSHNLNWRRSEDDKTGCFVDSRKGTLYPSQVAAGKEALTYIDDEFSGEYEIKPITIK